MSTRQPRVRHHADVRSPVWAGALAALASAALLVAFHQVVRGAVVQGEVRRQAAAARVDAVWRCNARRVLHAQDDCRSQLDVAIARR